MRRLNSCIKIAVAGTVLALCTKGTLSYATEIGTITTMSEKVYENMDEDGNVVGNVIMGSTFTLLDATYDSEGNVWYKIETDAGQRGYIRAEKVANSNQTQSGIPVSSATEEQEVGNEEIINDNNNNNNVVSDTNISNNNNQNENNADPIQQESYKIQVVATQTINIRKEPSTDSDVVAKMPEGTTVDSLGIFENAGGERWYEVSYLGIDGYVMEKVVDTIEVPVDVESEQAVQSQTTTSTTTSKRYTNKTSSTTDNEEKIEGTSTQQEVADVTPTTKSKAKFHFYIDWVLIGSLIGSLLCIGVILRLMNIIRKLEK